MNRKQFFTLLADRLTTEELAYVQKAYWLAKEAHRRQSRRLTGERYFEHLRRVALLAGEEFGYWRGDIIALCLLHDVIEDTYTPPDVIASLFGAKMHIWCRSLSKEIGAFDAVTGEMIRRAKLTDDQYYGDLFMAHKEPRIVKGCDRIDNLGDLASWDAARRQKYEAETRTRVLPIIQVTDLRMVAEIEKRLAVGMAA